MKKEINERELEQVLTAFQRKCHNPSASDILTWTQRYPHLSEEIISFAASLKDLAAAEKLSVKPDDRMISIAQSYTMNLLHEARSAASAESASSVTFDQILKSSQTNIPDLARSLDVARSVLAALIGGRMKSPIGPRLVEALTKVWSISKEKLDGAAEAALTRPQLGMLKADESAKVNALSYEELIKSSSMSESRKKYWLGED